MKDIKLALVGYLNTKPFEYGLKTSASNKLYSIYYDNPVNCVKLYENDKVDVALVPVGALPTIGDYKIVTNTCIGCDDYVRTVVLMSNNKIEDCNHVILDSHSRSSVMLSKILLKEYWKLKTRFTTAKVEDNSEIESGEAILMIGDKVFENESKYKYSYDLGHYWKQMTGLPFAYAVWIAKNYVPQSAIDQLSTDLHIGVNSIDKVLEEQIIKEPTRDLSTYYRDNIDYVLDDDKKKALDLYLEKIANLELVEQDL